MRTAAGQAGRYIRKARTQARDGVRRGARGRCPVKPRNATSRGVRPRRARVMTGLPGHAAALAGRRAWRRAWAGRPTAAEDDGGWRATLARAVPGRAVVHRLRALEAREVFGDSVRSGVAGRLHQSCTAPPRTFVSHNENFRPRELLRDLHTWQVNRRLLEHITFAYLSCPHCTTCPSARA